MQKKLCHHANTVSCEITLYEVQIEADDPTIKKKVEVVIMDCPGLGDPILDEKSNLTAISDHCQDVDLLIYCFDIRLRFTKSDSDRIQAFNESIGSVSWSLHLHDSPNQPNRT